MVAIAIADVAVQLGGRPVLDGISAAITGGFTGIIGPNGAGKSTLMRAIMGLLPLGRGRIAIDGTAVGQLPARALARRIAYLPQGQILHWPLSVERLVALGRLPYLAPFSRLQPADLAAIEAAMARAHVQHLRARDATTLSGGERARVMLARALAVGAPALIADEPLLSLDPGHQIDVMELLRAEADAGTTVLTVLHDLTLAARHCSRLLLIDHGRLVADGPPMEVLSPARLAAVYGIRASFGGNADAPLIIPTGRIAGAAARDAAAP